MSISKDEFEVAMTMYEGASLLYGQVGTRVRHIMPCFSVGEFVLLHSGSDYVVITNKNIPKELMDKMIAELGEANPYMHNLLPRGELHSLEEVITLVTMNDGKYSKETVDELVHKTRHQLLSPALQELLNCPAVKSIASFSSRYKSNSATFQSLLQAVQEFDKTVNPFADATLRLCNSSDWPSSIVLCIPDIKSDKTEFSLYSRLSSVTTCVSKPTIAYNCWAQRQNANFWAGHYYNISLGGSIIEEVIYFNYSDEVTGSKKNLRISLTSGEFWSFAETFKFPATDQEFETMTSYLKKTTSFVKEEITSKIFVKA